MMWAAGSLASVSMITYPAISALVSCNAEADQQGSIMLMVLDGLCHRYFLCYYMIKFIRLKVMSHGTIRN